ncbi:hypothetical protein BH11MYX1_BH11MYX1_25530 [soil metagenome]
MLGTALIWTARLAAIATVVTAVELLAVQRAFSEVGVFRWSVLRRDYTRAPRIVRSLADLAFSTGGTRGLVLVQLASGLALPWLDRLPVAALWPWLAVASTLLIAIRFRGTYNGGSDAMLLVVLIGLAIATSGAPLVGLAYVAVQLVLSYFISGTAKLRDHRWRDGTALSIMVGLPQYAVPVAAARVFSIPAIARGAGLGMLAFECLFPVALVDERACVAMLGVAAVFHLVNAWVFGLNRFLWAWIAAFPALIFWAERLRG